MEFSETLKIFSEIENCLFQIPKDDHLSKEFAKLLDLESMFNFIKMHYPHSKFKKEEFSEYAKFRTRFNSQQISEDEALKIAQDIGPLKHLKRNSSGSWVKKAIACGLIAGVGLTVHGVKAKQVHAKSIGGTTCACCNCYDCENKSQKTKLEKSFIDKFYESIKGDIAVARFINFKDDENVEFFIKDSEKESILISRWDFSKMTNEEKKKLDIYSAPTTIVYKNGKEYKRFAGDKPEIMDELKKIIDEINLNSKNSELKMGE